MKKSLFLLIMMAMLFPFAMQAQNSAKVVVVDSLTACDSLQWIDGVTYRSDANVFYNLNDTLHVLVLQINTSASHVDAPVSFGCVYTWHDRDYTVSDTYTDTLSNAAGCDSIVSIVLTRTGIHRDTLEAVTACGSYTWMDEALTTSDFYSDTVHSETYNCDSITVLPLTISTTIQYPTDSVKHCGQYVWHGETYTESGAYTMTHSNETIECDSVYKLVLIVDTLRDTLAERSFCDHYDWIIGQDTVNITEDGDYTLISVDASGCHTEHFRHVVIVTLRTVNDTIDTIRCGAVNYRFEGDPISATYRISAGDSTIQKLFSTRTAAMCRDSLSVVRCHIKPVARRTDTIDACDSYAWNESTYTISTFDSVVYTKQAANGCDSVQRMFIRITPSPAITRVGGDLELNGGGDATVFAESDQSNAEFSWDVVSTGESVEGDTVTLHHINASTDVLLTVTNPESGCYVEQWLVVMVNVGIHDADNTVLRVYPNPTTARLVIEGDVEVREATVFNAIGQCVSRTQMEGVNSLSVDGLSNGTYTLQLQLQNGETLNRKFVVSK